MQLSARWPPDPAIIPEIKPLYDQPEVVEIETNFVVIYCMEDGKIYTTMYYHENQLTNITLDIFN